MLKRRITLGDIKDEYGSHNHFVAYHGPQTLWKKIFFYLIFVKLIFFFGGIVKEINFETRRGVL